MDTLQQSKLDKIGAPIATTSEFLLIRSCINQSEGLITKEVRKRV